MSKFDCNLGWYCRLLTVLKQIEWLNGLKDLPDE